MVPSATRFRYRMAVKLANSSNSPPQKTSRGLAISRVRYRSSINMAVKRSASDLPAPRTGKVKEHFRSWQRIVDGRPLPRNPQFALWISASWIYPFQGILWYRTETGLHKSALFGSSPKGDTVVGDPHSSERWSQYTSKSPVAKGAMADRPDLVVHPLHVLVGDPDARPDQNPVGVSPEYLGKLREGLQPAMAEAPEPLAKARLHDEVIQPQEGRQSDVLPTTMKDTSKQTDERVNDILFGPLERPALQLLCRHMPAWINPDMLTAIGVVGGLIAAIGYWLSNFDRNFLWLVDFGLALDWFGDSLDGTLARYRKIERFRYGYFIDHTLDTFKQTIICIGLGLSPFVGFNYAMLTLVGYLQLGILTYVKTAVTGIFKISYGKIGPTEVRVIVIGANAVFYFASNPMIHFSFINISLFNLLVLGLAVALFIYFIVFTLTEAASLNKQDKSKKNSV